MIRLFPQAFVDSLLDVGPFLGPFARDLGQRGDGRILKIVRRPTTGLLQFRSFQKPQGEILGRLKVADFLTEEPTGIDWDIVP